MTRFLLLILCLIPTIAQGAAYTSATRCSSVFCSWSSAASWTQAAVPGTGDTVTVQTGHTVTVSDARTVGTAPTDQTTYVIDVVGTGILRIQAPLTVKGNIRTGMGSSGLPWRILGGPGGSLTMDNSGGYASGYMILLGSAGNAYGGMKLDGTNGNSFVVQSTAGNTYSRIKTSTVVYATIQATYTNFNRLGSTTGAAIGDSAIYAYQWLNSTGLNIIFSHCNFDNTNQIGNNAYGATAAKMQFLDCNFTNRLGSNSIWVSGYTVEIKRCSLDGAINMSGDLSHTTISDCILRSRLFFATTSTGSPTLSNLLLLEIGARNAASPTFTFTGTASDIYALHDYTDTVTSNNHTTAPFGTFSITRIVSEIRSLIGPGDAGWVDVGDIVTPAILTATGTIYNFLVLPATVLNSSNNKFSSGGINWWNTTGGITIRRMTAYMPGLASSNYYAHNSGSHTDMMRTENSLFWNDGQAISNTVMNRENAGSYWNSVVDSIDPVYGMRKNAFYNIASGTNYYGGIASGSVGCSPATCSTVATPIDILGASFNHFSVAPTWNNIGAITDPLFVDKGRNFHRWAREVRGHSGTDNQVRDAALTDIQADYTLINNAPSGLIPWVMTGYETQNVALSGTGLSGEDVGASSVSIDTIAPTINSFTVATPAQGVKIVSITALAATDSGSGVAGYYVTGSDTSCTGTDVTGATFTSAPPTYPGFTTWGNKYLCAWAKDITGNISTATQTTVTLTAAPDVGDVTAPLITLLTVPATATVPDNVPVTIHATDAVGVSAYILSDTITSVTGTTAGWVAVTPATTWSGSGITYTFSSRGAHTLRAWVRDSAGNISDPVTAAISITDLAQVADVQAVAAAILATPLVESYAAPGAQPTLSQLLYMIHALLGGTGKTVSGTTMNLQGLDGTTVLQYQMNSATSPSQILRVQ